MMHGMKRYEGAVAPFGSIASCSEPIQDSMRGASIHAPVEAIRAYPHCGARPATPLSLSCMLAFFGFFCALVLAFPFDVRAQEHKEPSGNVYDERNALLAAPPDDMFIDIQVPAHQLYLGETMRVEYDVYIAARRGIADYHGEDPDFVNWYKILTPPPHDSQVSVNGKPYTLVPYDAYFVSPMKIGKIPLPTIRVQVPYIATKPWITHAPRIIEVIPLPEPAPEGFAFRNVGHFTIQADFSETDVEIGDVVIATIEVQSDTPVSGVQIAPYALTQSASAFKLYPLKKVFIEEKVVQNELQSTLRYQLRMLALEKGTWTLDPFRIITFDPDTHQYQTISTQPTTITVDGESVVSLGNEPRLRSDILDSYSIRTIQLSPSPYSYKVPVWCFLIAPLLLISLIVLTKVRIRIVSGQIKKEQLNSLRDKLMALGNATTASEQNELLSSILSEQFGTPILRRESEMKTQLLHTFSESEVTFIVSFLRDLRLTSYSTKQPLEKERTQALIDILKKTKPVEEIHE